VGFVRFQTALYYRCVTTVLRAIKKSCMDKYGNNQGCIPGTPEII